MEQDDYIVILILRFAILFGLGGISGFIISEAVIPVPKYGDKFELFLDFLYLYIVPFCTFNAFIMYLKRVNIDGFIKNDMLFYWELYYFSPVMLFVG